MENNTKKFSENIQAWKNTFSAPPTAQNCGITLLMICFELSFKNILTALTESKIGRIFLNSFQISV